MTKTITLNNLDNLHVTLHKGGGVLHVEASFNLIGDETIARVVDCTTFLPPALLSAFSSRFDQLMEVLIKRELS